MQWGALYLNDDDGNDEGGAQREAGSEDEQASEDLQTDKDWLGREWFSSAEAQESPKVERASEMGSADITV